MIQTSRYSYIIYYLFIELFLTLISSINWICLLISLIIYIILLLKENEKCDRFHDHYFSSLIFSLFHYFLFTLSYAEILPWETFIVIVLIILIIYYQRKLYFLTNKTYLNCFNFGKNPEEFDSNLNLLITKYFVTNICFYFYTFHLCSTTICTPQMYFNWFLIINNCRYTYFSFFSSYTLSGGFIVSLTWTFISIYYLIRFKFR